MKKFLSIIAVTAVIGIFPFSYKPTQAVAEKTVNKIIQMAVFTDNNYTPKIYDAATAGLTVTVKKVGSNKNEVVWEKSFPALALKFFPGTVNPFKMAIEIPGMLEKDVLQVSYTLTYNANGNILQMQGDEMFEPKGNGQLEINI